MAYVEMRHSGISHDLKTEMEVIPRLGDIVDFRDGDDEHIFVVDRVVHVYEDHRLRMIYLSGQQRPNWGG
jgi:hypothetical protein